MKARTQKKNTALFFDSFKHFKHNLVNLIYVELPTLMQCKDLNEYANLKSVNYKSKIPDMKKIGLINYERIGDNKFELTKIGEQIYEKVKYCGFTYNRSDISDRLQSFETVDLKEALATYYHDSNALEELKLLSMQMILEYADTADCIRPYLLLLNIIEKKNILMLDKKTLINILAQSKTNVLLLNLNTAAERSLSNDLLEELKRPISYIYNFLEMGGIIDSDKNIVYDKIKIRALINQLDTTVEKQFKLDEDTSRSASEQSDFRKRVLKAYNYKCAITGKAIKVKNSRTDQYNYLLEAAHFIPYSEGGSFATNNGIALCHEMHKLFDSKLFTFEYVDDDTIEIIITKNDRVIDDDILSLLDHKKIILPSSIDEMPAREALEYRKQKWLL